MLSSDAPRRGPRSLGVLGLRVMAFAGLVIPGAVYVERSLSAIPNSYSVKRDAMLDKAAELQVVVLGASTTLRGVRPKLFRVPAYNLADASESIYFAAQNLDRYLSGMRSLRSVIWVIDYSSFASWFSNNPEYWRQYFYERVDGFSPEGPLDEFDIRRWSWFFLYTPLVSLDLLLGNDRNELVKDIGTDGWQRTTGTSPTLTAAGGIEKLAYLTKLMRDETIPLNIAILDRSLDLLRQREVATALVVLPVYRTYSSAINPRSRARMIEALRALATRHGATYVDYFEDERFGIDDFKDNDHLNETGATKISRILDEQVVAPAVMGPRRWRE